MADGPKGQAPQWLSPVGAAPQQLTHSTVTLGLWLRPTFRGPLHAGPVLFYFALPMFSLPFRVSLPSQNRFARARARTHTSKTQASHTMILSREGMFSCAYQYKCYLTFQMLVRRF